jgi:DNA-binding NarL/FixJ family response regulator
LIGLGRGAQEIADQLHLSPKTVDVHRANIREKLGLKDSTALTVFAVRWLETRNPAS